MRLGIAKARALTTTLVLATLLPSLGARAGGPAEALDVSVAWDEARQTIVGFGGTMGWIHPGERVREEVFDLLFTRLGASVLRIRALGGEGGDELSLEPENDNDDPATFNWPAFPIRETEHRNAVIIKGALDRGVRTVVPASWSPPGWMKTTGRRAGGGTLADGMLEEFAETWAAYVIGMRREFGIRLRYLSIQNEPDLAYTYPTCRLEPDLYARARRAVQARLDRENLGVRVLGPDTCRIYNLLDYIAAEARLARDLGRPLREGASRDPILTHLYDLAIPYEEVDRDAARWRNAREIADVPGGPLWLMETANFLSGTEPGSWDEAIIWARKIHHALVDGGCEVVCYWSLFFDKRGEALVYCRESDLDEYDVTPKYWTSMNFYRFVRPGMVRVEAGARDPDLFVTGFRAPDGGAVREREGEGGPPAGVRRPPPTPSRVVVIVNWGGSPKRVRLPAAAGERWQRHESSATRNCERVPWAPPVAELPERSVTTFALPAPR